MFDNLLTRIDDKMNAYCSTVERGFKGLNRAAGRFTEVIEWVVIHVCLWLIFLLMAVICICASPVWCLGKIIGEGSQDK